jgi:hypothetical protein
MCCVEWTITQVWLTVVPYKEQEIQKQHSRENTSFSSQSVNVPMQFQSFCWRLITLFVIYRPGNSVFPEVLTNFWCITATSAKGSIGRACSMTPAEWQVLKRYVGKSLVRLHYRKVACVVPGLQIHFWTIKNGCLKFKRKSAAPPPLPWQHLWGKIV